MYSFFCVSCATPQTNKSEFLIYAQEKLAHHDFTVDTSYDETKLRLNQFVENCLNVKVTREIKPLTPKRPVLRQASNYSANIEEINNQLTLYLSFVELYSFDIKSDPVYVFLAQINKGDLKNKTIGKTSYYDDIMGRNTEAISNSLIAWIKNEKKLCPFP
jgi:hypothetical protein